jgi:phosphoglycolate phosphatase-like HAD superfamily hydrolase
MEGMRFIIELEGPVFDVGGAYHEAHLAAAREVGWSHLDAATFWRLFRTKGKEADFLPAAKPIKIAEYQRRFEERLEVADTIRALRPRAGVGESLAALARYGPCHAVTLASNIAVRREVLGAAGLLDRLGRVEALNRDPRRRGAELQAMAESDSRCVVVAGCDAVARAAQSAELLTVGLTNGPCVAARLHQGGADVVYGDLSELAESLRQGAPDLTRAGLLPGY